MKGSEMLNQTVTSVFLPAATLLLGLSVIAATQPAAGPLRVHPDNPRYFADDSGRAVPLVGSHTWDNLQDMGEGEPSPFDWTAYLDFLEHHHHNFIRLWRWELTTWDTRAAGEQRRLVVAPHPWARTGPGEALDGRPRFDLERFDPDYFGRLRERVQSAGQRGIYVSIMLFEGWGMQFVPDAWQAHPFHSANNINGIDGDVDGDGKGLEIHELAHPQVLALQEAYVRQVVDTVNDLDNVLYEISNENHSASTEWQYHMIEYIKAYQQTRPNQHPVGMTFQYQGGSNEALFRSPADWISPNPQGGYRDDPPAAGGSKVIINDTDHLWGIGGSHHWVWKSFLRGMNPIFMDPYGGNVLGEPFAPRWESIRRALGQTRQLAERLDLAAMTPHGDRSSTRYCLANPNGELLIYQPEAGQPFTVELEPGLYHAEWIHPGNGRKVVKGPFQAEGTVPFEAPFGDDAVLYLYRVGG